MEHAGERRGVHLPVSAEMEALKRHLHVTNIATSPGRSQARNHDISMKSSTFIVIQSEISNRIHLIPSRII